MVSRSEADGVCIFLLGAFASVWAYTPSEEGAWRLRKARSLVKLLALTPDHRMHRK